ncbi:MAG: hypothetical protein ACI9Y1_000942 [Lentisphaeria bacterium]|jgi:hypothetical protein
MTMQRVNLYRPELRPKKEWITANTLVAVVLGFVLIISASVYLQNRNLVNYEKQVAFLEAQKLATQNRIDFIRAEVSPKNSKDIDANIEKLQRTIKAREQVSQIIQGQNLGNEAGFSESMNALARQSLASVSLARFRISRGGSYVEIEGETRTPGDVPKYVQYLLREPSFVGVQFGLLSMAEGVNNSRHKFSIGFDSVYQLASKKGGK